MRSTEALGQVYQEELGITPTPRQAQMSDEDLSETKFEMTQVNADGSMSFEINEGVEIGSTSNQVGNFFPITDHAYRSPLPFAESNPHDIVAIPGVGDMTIRSALAGGFRRQDRGRAGLAGKARRR